MNRTPRRARHKHPTTPRKPPLPAPVAAVLMLAEDAQIMTGRPMPEAEICELLAQAREIEFRRLLEGLGTPRLDAVHWSPTVQATLRGEHIPELLWRSTDPSEVPLVMPRWARTVPEIAAAIDAGLKLRRDAGLPT